jgi:hypothetical protein
MTAWAKFYISRVFIQLTKKKVSILILKGCFVMLHCKQHFAKYGGANEIRSRKTITL